MKRLFFALWPDEKARGAIARASRTAVRRCGGRPVPAENYHITLAFLGDVAAPLYTDIVAAGRAASARFALCPLELRLDRFGYWPGPRVFWLGASENPPALSALAAALRTGAETLGIPGENRAFHAHVTLCRKVQRAPNTDPPQLTWRASGFTLVESVTAESGAQYTVVERFQDSSPDDP